MGCHCSGLHALQGRHPHGTLPLATLASQKCFVVECLRKQLEIQIFKIKCRWLSGTSWFLLTMTWETHSFDMCWLNQLHRYQVEGCCLFPARIAAVSKAAVLFSLSGRQSRTCLCVGGDRLVCVLSCDFALFFWQNPLIIILSSFSSLLTS